MNGNVVGLRRLVVGEDELGGLLQEQREGEGSVGACLLLLSCDDGAIPLHPHLLLNASPTARELLQGQVSSRLATTPTL